MRTARWRTRGPSARRSPARSAGGAPTSSSPRPAPHVQSSWLPPGSPHHGWGRARLRLPARAGSPGLPGAPARVRAAQGARGPPHPVAVGGLPLRRGHLRNDRAEACRARVSPEPASRLRGDGGARARPMRGVRRAARLRVRRAVRPHCPAVLTLWARAAAGRRDGRTDTQ